MSSISRLLATWFGCGLARVGPGTVATAATLPLYWLLRELPLSAQLALTLVIVAVSVVTANRVAADMRQQDPQIVVIDEVSGALLALLVVDSGRLLDQIGVLLLFRLLDIYKPWPINLDLHRPYPGVGIVYDDVVAGLGAGVIFEFLIRISSQLHMQ